MESSNTTVSIIIPLYNKEDYLQETLNCIISQSYQYLEILIIDDCSTDSSLDLANKFAENDARIKIFRNDTNKGGNYSRNLGIANATGDWVLFFDADDLMDPDCIKNRIAHVSSSVDGLISAMGTFLHSIGDNPNTNWIPTEQNLLERFLSHKLPWTIMQPLWRRKFILEHGGFNEKYSRLQDVDFHTKLLVNNARIAINPISIPDCFYRIVEGRHAVSKFEFFKKWVFSAKLFYTDYSEIQTVDSKNLLNGTLIETISQILHSHKLKNLKRQESKALIKDLLSLNISTFNKIYLQFYSFIQLNSPVHIPGLKKVMRTILKSP